MRSFYHHLLPGLLGAAILTCTANPIQGQTPASSADSIQISNAHATGESATGQVELSLTFTNHYSNTATVHLVLGGFDGLGLVDDKGTKYKIHTTDQLANTADINKGYVNIAFVQFGDKQYKWLTFVEQKIPPGDSRQLVVRISKVATTVSQFSKIITRRQVSINYAFKADRTSTLADVPIVWHKQGATR